MGEADTATLLVSPGWDTSSNKVHLFFPNAVPQLEAAACPNAAHPLVPALLRRIIESQNH